MKKSRLYVFIFLGISVVVLLAGFVSLQYFYRSAERSLWDTQLESGQRETREIAVLLEQQLRAGLPEEQVIRNLQQSILNTDIRSEFICMYNTQGIELCHPDPALVGQKIGENNSRFYLSESEKEIAFSEVLRSGEQYEGIRSFSDPARSSEIVSVYPVGGTDWMVAFHANISVLQTQLSGLYNRFMLGALLGALAVILCCFGIVRWIYRKYEKATEAEKKELTEKVNQLTAFNESLRASREKSKEQSVTALIEEEAASRKRIVTYHKNEMVAIQVEEIAFFNLVNGMTYIHTFSGQKFQSNNSLDELIKQVGPDSFYRANRQFLINVQAIKNIWMYGKNQLRITVEPDTGETVVISKNKVAEFKQWLDR